MTPVGPFVLVSLKREKMEKMEIGFLKYQT
jgi:hypothetical protein